MDLLPKKEKKLDDLDLDLLGLKSEKREKAPCRKRRILLQR